MDGRTGEGELSVLPVVAPSDAKVTSGLKGTTVVWVDDGPAIVSVADLELGKNVAVLKAGTEVVKVVDGPPTTTPNDAGLLTEPAAPAAAEVGAAEANPPGIGTTEPPGAVE